MTALKISFEIGDSPLYAVAHKDGRKTLEIQVLEGIALVGVHYDYNRRPLELTSEIKSADKVEIVLLEHRIELYVNGKILDEEWPCGNRLFALGDTVISDSSISVEEYTVTEEQGECVISSFENAQGWMPGNGVFVGDCMPYFNDGAYHVLYLKDRHHHKSKWGMGAHQWEHISTTDFKKWLVHPMAVPITHSWEGSICTGSWIKNGDVEYLYYTVRRAHGLPAIITRSISYDGYHFVKDEGFGFTVSDKYHAPSARDPKVIRGEDGLFHMILTTSLTNEQKNGCLAHYVSADMEKWDEVPELIYTVPNTAQPECPDYFKYKGKYYLVFSLYGKGQYMVSDKPFEDFRAPSDASIPCAGVPKCAPWGDKLVFTGFDVISGYAGTMTFKRATANDDGVLIFEDMTI